MVVQRATVARDWRQYHWIFLATAPHSGSTALAQIVRTAPLGTTLNDKGEGHWIMPELSAPGVRWDPDLPVDYQKLRDVWSARARRRNSNAKVVFDKSPSNLVRMRRLWEEFGGADGFASIISLVRNPFVLLASRIKRMAPEAALIEGANIGSEFCCFLREQSESIADMFARLAELSDISKIQIRYEELVSRPAEQMRELTTQFPALAEANPNALLKVKKLAEQPLEDKSAHALRYLTPLALEVAHSVFCASAQNLERFGYDPDPSITLEQLKALAAKKSEVKLC